MNLRHLGCSLLLPAIAISAATAAPAAPKAPQSPLRLTGCIQYLQLTAIQNRVIAADEARINKLKLELVSLQAEAQAGHTAEARELLTGAAFASGEVKRREAQMRSLTRVIDFNREGLSIIEDIYRDCIKKPPRVTSKPAQQTR